jgi:phthalate 4,5-dioxygenase oxygenase subunit
MLTAEENDLLTRTGPCTPAGELLRRYWQPAALSEELPAGGPARPVALLGEELVLFRDLSGQPGLLGRLCAHRGADLSYGRLEDGGLRCPYHGWLYDIAGHCLEQPAEPTESRFHEKIRQVSYPCRERNGIVYAYLGAGEPPPMPAFDWLLAPEAYVFVFKGYMECNYLQANEGEIDPSHLSFLHRYLQDEFDKESYGEQLLESAQGTDIPVSRIIREQVSPTIEIEETDFGVRIFTLRDIDSSRRHVRTTNFLFPNAAVVAVGTDAGGWGLVQYHVPIDDSTNWRYDIFYSFKDPIPKETLRRQRLETYSVPEYRPRRNKANRYLYDHEEQKKNTYIGVGFDVNVHDTWATEGPGPIQNRSLEHLGSTDKAIAAARRMLLRGIRSLQDGGDVQLTGQDVGTRSFMHLTAIDTVAPRVEWRTFWREVDAARRQASPWAGEANTPGPAPNLLESNVP